MEIVTGKIGTPHVSSADDRAFHAATFGVGNYVLNVGSQFKATIETSNNIVLADGDLVINGTHARIPHGETDTVIIENGTTGYNRIDLIVARYTKSSGLESVALAVVKGETVSGTPTRPSHTEGNILDGVELAEMPLYAVQLSGVNVASITPLFTIATGLDDVYRKNEVDSIKRELQTNINTVQSNASTGISKAQTTANKGVTNAAAAQSTANTAVSNAATAQSTADSAKNIANSAKTTADTANTRSWNNETKITGMKSTLTSYISYFDDLSSRADEVYISGEATTENMEEIADVVKGICDHLSACFANV